jgi:hypothetical protein
MYADVTSWYTTLFVMIFMIIETLQGNSGLSERFQLRLTQAFQQEFIARILSYIGCELFFEKAILLGIQNRLCRDGVPKIFCRRNILH